MSDGAHPFIASTKRLLDCAKQADIITNLVVKYKMSRRVDGLSLEEKCQRLKSCEHFVQTQLKAAVLRRETEDRESGYAEHTI